MEKLCELHSTDLIKFIVKVLSITLLILPFYAVPIALVERIVEIPMWIKSQAASGLIEPHNWSYLLVGGGVFLAADIALLSGFIAAFNCGTRMQIAMCVVAITLLAFGQLLYSDYVSCLKSLFEANTETHGASLSEQFEPENISSVTCAFYYFYKIFVVHIFAIVSVFIFAVFVTFLIFELIAQEFAKCSNTLLSAHQST